MMEVFEQKLLTEAEAAIYLGVSRSFLRATRCYGNRPGYAESPPYVRLGRAIRYPRESLDLWIDSRLVQTEKDMNHE